MKYWATAALLLVLVTVPAAGEAVGTGNTAVGFFIDAGSIDFIVSDQFYLRGGIGIAVTDGLRLDLPVTAVVNRSAEREADYAVVDMGVLLKYYPGGGDFWTGLTLFQGVGFIGSAKPERQYHYMTEMVMGYTFNLGSGWYLEPALTFRDPLGTFRDSLDYVNQHVSGYGEYRLNINLGWIPWVLM